MFCAAGVALFVWLYLGTFSIGYLDEDFAWLAWRHGATAGKLFSPAAQVYYRPLAVNVPYYFLSSTAAGLAAWKALALAVMALGALLIPLSATAPAQRRPACLLSLLWLLSPFLSFPAFYPNAFDYALFPFLTLSLLFALAKGRFPLAVLLFAAALLSKEQGLGLFLAPLVAGERRAPRWYWAATSGVAAIYLAAHSGFSWSSHLAGGFGVSLDPVTVASAAARTLAALFFGTRLGPWGLAWHAAALAAVACGLFELARAGGRTRQLRIARTLAFVILLVSPFFLLPDVEPAHLGGGSWAVLFFALAESTARIGQRARKRLEAILLAGTVLAAVAAVRSLPAVEKFYRDESASFAELVASAQPLLGDCTPADRVVLEGLPAAYGDVTRARYAYWALRARFREPRLYLLQGSAAPDFEIAPGEKRGWAEPWRAAGHPRLTFARQPSRGSDATEPVRVRALPSQGDPGCGKPVKP